MMGATAPDFGSWEELTKNPCPILATFFCRKGGSLTILWVPQVPILGPGNFPCSTRSLRTALAAGLGLESAFACGFACATVARFGLPIGASTALATGCRTTRSTRLAAEGTFCAEAGTRVRAAVGGLGLVIGACTASAGHTAAGGKAPFQTAAGTSARPTFAAERLASAGTV